jgi:putative transposase
MLIGRLFHVRYTPRGTSYLHRTGFTPQVPVHRAAERGEAAITAWRTGTWAKLRGYSSCGYVVSGSFCRADRAF